MKRTVNFTPIKYKTRTETNPFKKSQKIRNIWPHEQRYAFTTLMSDAHTTSQIYMQIRFKKKSEKNK